MQGNSWPLYSISLLLIISLAGNAYLFFTLRALETESAAAAANYQTAAQEAARAAFLASTTITDLRADLFALQEELAEAEDDYRDEKRRNDELEDEVRDTINTVRDLDKLSKTDRELLQKYSKVYFLNENYIPAKLRKIDDDFVAADRATQFFHGDALPFLENLLEAAEKDGIELKIASAYRSFDMQAELKGQFTQTYGTGANTFSADQGYSEHQLGTAVDFVVPENTTLSIAFAQTDAYKWLLDNAHRYGFTLSYPEGNQFYIFEPWHWRFVGTELARDLKRDDAHFYDWDQRTIDEYLLNIFD